MKHSCKSNLIFSIYKLFIQAFSKMHFLKHLLSTTKKQRIKHFFRQINFLKKGFC